jgi:hypothetical protein
VLFAVNSGLRQFLDLGAGIPTVGSVHEVAHTLDPETRVAYVDVDPIATALSRDILAGSPRAVAVQADALQPERLLQHPELTRTLDLRQPLAVLLVAFLHLVPDEDQAQRVVHAYRDACAPGSFLAISHATHSFSPERSARTASVFNRATSPVTLRSREQIQPFFDGYELVEPGLVPTPSWRPESSEDLFATEPERAQAFAGVGVKP